MPPKNAPEDDFFAVCGPSAPQQKVGILVPTEKMDEDRVFYWILEKMGRQKSLGNLNKILT